MANPVFYFENRLDEIAGTTTTAIGFDERADGPIARTYDRDPTRMTLIADAAGTWNTQVEVRWIVPAAGTFSATHLYIPAGHNLDQADAVTILSSVTGSTWVTEHYFASPATELPSSQPVLVDMTGSFGIAERYFALRIDDVDRATTQVVYQIPEVFFTRPRTLTRGVDPGWEHTVVKNLRVFETESGAIRVVKRGPDRRSFSYQWNQVEAADLVVLEELIESDAARVGFPMVPAGETQPVFVRIAAVDGPRQESPIPDSVPRYTVGIVFVEVL